MRLFLTLILLSLTSIGFAAEDKPNIIIVSAKSLPTPLLSGENEASKVSQLISKGVTFRYVWASHDADVSDHMLTTGMYKDAKQATLVDSLKGAGYQILNAKQPIKPTQQTPFFAWLKPDISDINELEKWLQSLPGYKNTLFFITARKGQGAETSMQTNATVSVPLIVSGHGVRNPKRECWDLVDLTDMFPTIMELVGLPIPECDGKSFLPSLNDSPDPFKKRNWIHTQHGDKWMIRDWENILHHDETFLRITSGELTTSPIRKTDKIAPHRLERLKMLADRLHKTAAATNR